MVATGAPSASAKATSSRSPRPGFEQVLNLEFWSDEDREALRTQLLEKFSADLKSSGSKVTKEGIQEPPRSYVPTTRGLDKELRFLRRDVALHRLPVLVLHGGSSLPAAGTLRRLSDRSRFFV